MTYLFAATDSSKPWDKVEREMFLSKNHFRSGLGHRVTITKAIFAWEGYRGKMRRLSGQEMGQRVTGRLEDTDAAFPFYTFLHY